MTGFQEPLIPVSYIIFQESGTIYAQNGLTGDIDYSGTDAVTVIQSAIDALTSGRTWRERVVLKGDFTLYKQSGQTYCIKVPTYTILDLTQARLYLADSQDCDIIYLEGAADSSPKEHSEIWGGLIEGNKDNQASGHGIVIYKGSASIIKDTVINNVKQDGLRYTGENWDEWSGLHRAHNVRIYNCGRYGIYCNYHNDNLFDKCVVQNSGSHNVYLFGIHRLFYVHSIYAGGSSFYLPEGCDGTRLVECDADTPESGQDNIYIGGDRNAIIGGYVHGHGSSDDGIVLASTASKNQIQNVHISGGNYAVREESGADYNIVTGNVGRNNGQSSPFSKTGSNSIFDNNLVC